jgi:hypothetical protein
MVFTSWIAEVMGEKGSIFEDGGVEGWGVFGEFFFVGQSVVSSRDISVASSSL